MTTIDVRDTLRQVWANRGTKAIAVFLAACMFMAIGALWSPQSREVNDLRTCLRQADQLHTSPDHCWPLVIKVGKS